MAVKTSRRRFLERSAAAITTTSFLPGSVFSEDRPSASERVSVGVVGLGANGSRTLGNLLNRADVQVLAVCDVHELHHRDKQAGEGRAFGREPARLQVDSSYAKETKSGHYRGCDAYADYRELCAREDIDAVFVATPDHWHALCTLEALRAGKDVYCEKPITHLFAEGQMVCREVAKQNAIFQTGSQQRSEIRFRIAAEVVLNGLIGKVHTVEVGLPTGPKLALVKPSSATEHPAGLDYDFWCGPSPVEPYIFARHHRNWRWHLSYGGGQIMDWIGHHNDIAHWGLGMDTSGPETVESVGWTYPPESSVYNAPVDYEVLCTYPGGITSSISNRHQMGTKWIGEEGWVSVSRGNLAASNRQWIVEKFDRGPVKAYQSLDHLGNFIEGIQQRKPCIAPAETGHRSVTPGHLGFVSEALGRKLNWDPAAETIVDDPEADQLLKSIDYRSPWELT
ncbi:MAG: Gfo/Idh/MocA family oxidoreductase [Verrucomicrobiota bacterium]